MSVDKFLIVSGEPSGDLLGGGLMAHLQKLHPGTRFYGIGGEKMQECGLDSLADIESMTVIGLTGIVKKYRYLKSLARQLVETAQQQQIQYAILIDYPGFNLRLAEMLHQIGVKNIFYVSPQIWAWRFKRIYQIKRIIGLMLPLFSFEEKLYTDHGVHAKWVGHPLVPRLAEKLANASQINFPKEKTIICLMPGSRTSEITRLHHLLLQTAALIQETLPEQEFHFVIPGISNKNEEFILTTLQQFQQQNQQISIEYIFDKSIECISQSELVILASGTATLEVAALGKPMIITYTTGYLTYRVGMAVKKTKHIGMVNILAGDKTICRELLQKEARKELLCAEAVKILTDQKYRQKMIAELAEVKALLGDSDPSQKAAQLILEWTQKQG